MISFLVAPAWLGSSKEPFQNSTARQAHGQARRDRQVVFFPQFHFSVRFLVTREKENSYMHDQKQSTRKRVSFDGP